MGEAWTPAEEARLLERPYDYTFFNADNPNARTRKAFQIKRGMLGVGSDAPLTENPQNPAVLWDKKQSSATWRDYLGPMDQMQAVRSLASKNQDYANIAIASERPVPVAFVSDWHIGSWGVQAKDIASGTDRLLRLHEEYGLHMAVLGDMLEMAIRLRSVAEISGNLLTPSAQFDFHESWVRDMAPLILWATWDNHSVQREEELVGHSSLGSSYQNHTIYHSGIGHTDLTIGDHVYSLATSHRFQGRSVSNPVAGQMRYIMREAPDREIVVAGDSHIPAISQYTEAGKVKTVANCGSLQTNSRYAKRFFSLQTATAMPVVLLSPDEHVVQPFFSLEHFESFARKYLT